MLSRLLSLTANTDTPQSLPGQQGGAGPQRVDPQPRSALYGGDSRGDKSATGLWAVTGAGGRRRGGPKQDQGVRGVGLPVEVAPE